MSRFFDRMGRPISRDEWVELFEDKSYQQVAVEDVGDATVSTVWLGFNHGFEPDGELQIFETMIFGGAHDESQWRYATEKEALKGHALAVSVARGKRP